MSEMWCTRLAGNAGPKKSPKIYHLGTITQICPAISSQLRHISTIGKKLLNSNVSPACPHNMMNFGPLSAEIYWRVWGKFQRVSRLDSLTARHSSCERQPKFATLNTGCHLHSEGRPSRWALAHIVVKSGIPINLFMAAHATGQAIIFLPWFLLSSSFFFFSSPNLSRHRLDICHISTHGVAIV